MGGDFDGGLDGRTLGGRYRILRPIGAGGMGVVYEAEQTDLRRKVAIKVVLGADPRAIERFEQEALAMANLRCPNVVTLFDFHPAKDGEPPFLVMELLDGRSLSSTLGREKRFSVERAARIASQMLVGLSAAHAASIIHRDVKPANVFLVGSAVGGEVAKLLDFGIAKLAHGEGFHTTTGMVVGTPGYSSPEQLIGESIDKRTDLHGVGLCLFEMIAGRRPWRATQGPELIAEILRDEPMKLAAVSPETPAEMCAVVDRALAKNASDRFQTAEEMLEALGPWTRAAESSKPAVVDAHADTERREQPEAATATAVASVGAPLVRPSRPEKFPRWMLAAGAAVLAIPAGLTWLPRKATPPPRDSELLPAGSVIATDLGAGALPPMSAAAPMVALPPVPSAAPAVGEVAGCFCNDMRGGTPNKMCIEENAPKCECKRELRLQRTYCRVPRKGGKCPPGMEKPDEGVMRHGERCTGFFADEQERSDGVLSCDVCYAPKPSKAVPNERCFGHDWRGVTREGTWICKL